MPGSVLRTLRSKKLTISYMDLLAVLAIVAMAILIFILYRNHITNQWERKSRATAITSVEHPAPQDPKYVIRRIQLTKTKNGNCTQVDDQSFVSTEELLGRQKKFPRSVCNCSRAKAEIEPATKWEQSTCSDEATLLGGDQKVISYSLHYKEHTNSTLADSCYYRGVIPNLKGMKELYSGWVMRLYTNIPLNKEMCHLVCFDEDLYYCDARQLPELGDVQKFDPRTWRFLLLGDPTVEKFAVRDLDSRLTTRERDAVQHWDSTGLEFHAMRDHTLHPAEMMAGMWGGNNYKLCLNVGKTIRNEILQPAVKGLDDQQILTKVIYAKYKQQMLVHDSYLCETYNDSVPFPSKRPDSDYVGSQNLRPPRAELPGPCPKSCRPAYGMDWEFC